MAIQERTRAWVNAKYLLAAPPPDTTVLPAHIKITQVKEGRAWGATKRKGNAILGSTSPRSAFTRF